jgi:uncharacterized membrane protein YfcA
MIEPAIGFFIALAIGLTGIGGGTLTAPVLVLFLGLPAGPAVGTALVFGAVVKLAAAPMYLLRSQVSFRALGYMLAGGIPGVVLGSILINRMNARSLSGVILALVGLTVVFSAALNLLRLRKHRAAPARDRVRVLPWLALPIGLEVGFSSAGAGALGTLALLHFTSIAPVQVVGTDLLFGLFVSGIGGGLHLGLGGVDAGVFWKLVGGGIPGVLLGAHFASVVPARKLRVGLSMWLVYLGSHLLYRGLGSIVIGR